MPIQTTHHIVSTIANTSGPNTHTTTNVGTAATLNSMLYRYVSTDQQNIAHAKTCMVEVAPPGYEQGVLIQSMASMRK